MSNLVPSPMTFRELADFLQWVAAEVGEHDSWEGNIQWSMTDDVNADCEVTAVVRVGNLMGQGSIRMIGAPP